MPYYIKGVTNINKSGCAALLVIKCTTDYIYYAVALLKLLLKLLPPVRELNYSPYVIVYNRRCFTGKISVVLFAFVSVYYIPGINMSLVDVFYSDSVDLFPVPNMLRYYLSMPMTVLEILILYNVYWEELTLMILFSLLY